MQVLKRANLLNQFINNAAFFSEICFMYNSIKNTDEKNPSCDGGTPMEVPAEFENDVTIVYTHSVTFEVNTVLHRHKCCHI